MSIALTRMFAVCTLIAYITVGTFCARLLTAETSVVEVSTGYFELFSQARNPKNNPSLNLVAPELKFADIQFPHPAKVLVARRITPAEYIRNAREIFVTRVKGESELNFSEPVTMNRVMFPLELQPNLVSLYKDYHFTDALVVQDEVATKAAAPLNREEPEFFSYEEKRDISKARGPSEISDSVEQISVTDLADDATGAIKSQDNDDVLAFDYAKAALDIKQQQTPLAAVVTTQTLSPAPPVSASVSSVSNGADLTPATVAKAMTTQKPQASALLAGKNRDQNKSAPIYESNLSIQIAGTNFVKISNEVGFELRFQDDLSESLQDYNNGEVVLEQQLAQPRMTRSATVLKRGFAPTNTDLIVEAGDSEMILPLIEEGTFNEMMAPFESRGPIGAVLVELDEAVEGASLDVPHSKVLKLDEKLRLTNANDYVYQLFIGVKAGNALLTYKGTDGIQTSKIIHVHENELTFETNFFEKVENETVLLKEEDLLSKERMPLIIPADAVRQFASDKTSKKMNDHTYKMDFEKTLLGGRKYLELGHQGEPIFVGYKEAAEISVPAENFMRFVLSHFQDSKLGNRCLIQVNIRKKLARVDVGTESVAEALNTSVQMLDSDGKFYDSAGAKTRKLIVLGENQGAPELSQDGKINFKLTYADGSIQYFGSYCSPNTYLVEQL